MATVDRGTRMMEERQCMRCGVALPYGSLAYRVQVRAFADFDGVILEAEEEGRPTMEQLLEQVERTEPRDLEKEIYEEFTLFLCKSCRDRFIDEVQHPWEGAFRPSKTPERILH